MIRADDERKQDTEATRLIKLALATDHLELFHTPDRQPYASFVRDGSRETMPIRDGAFEHWLYGLYWRGRRRALSAQTLRDATSTLAAKALFEGATMPVHVRVAGFDGRVYLDLANETRNIVEVSADDWRVVHEAPVRFWRPPAILALPMPSDQGDICALRPAVNVSSDEAWILFVAWLLAALTPDGPFPVLAVTGEQGSAKSTLCRLAKRIVDPAKAPLRAKSTSTEDLLISATRSRVIAFDNLSRLTAEQSDALCRLSTGGGLSTRELYTNRGEVIFEAKRPTILNGIDDVVTRGDLLDRSICLTLSAIDESKRVDERTLWQKFEHAAPVVLAGLLDALVTGLRRFDSVELERKPRMADFARFVVAAEPALPWPAGAFIAAYARNRSAAHELALEDSPFVAPLRQLVTQRGGSWEGTATALLGALKHTAGETVMRAPSWPQSPRALSAALRRLAPNLRVTGIVLGFDERSPDRNRKRIITVRWREDGWQTGEDAGGAGDGLFPEMPDEGRLACFSA